MSFKLVITPINHMVLFYINFVLNIFDGKKSSMGDITFLLNTAKSYFRKWMEADGHVDNNNMFKIIC